MKTWLSTVVSALWREFESWHIRTGVRRQQKGMAALPRFSGGALVDVSDRDALYDAMEDRKAGIECRSAANCVGVQ